MSKSRKKQKKSRDMSRCCGSCSFASCQPDGTVLCSLDAVEVSPDSSCPRWGQEIHRQCQRCGKTVKFSDKAEMYAARVKAKIETGSGSSAQSFMLCHSCQHEAQMMFGELLDALVSPDFKFGSQSSA